MSRPLKTLFLMEDLCYGGTQKQNLALANGLDRSRFAAEILTLTGPTDLDGAVATHIPLHHLGSGRGVHPLFFYKLKGMISQLKPDILIPCTALPNIWGRIWGRVLKIPLVLGTCRGGGAPKRQHERYLWRLARQIVCNSPALMEVMKGIGVPEERLTYIPNGVDCEHFHSAEKKKDGKASLVLCVARLARDKDLPTLIDAFAILARANSQLRLRLVGEGPEEERLRGKIAALPADIGRRIEITGASADPARHYREADLFVLTSIREGQPNVILEAMSSSLPICATNVGGIPALLGDGAGGLLSAPGQAEELARNMGRLLEDGALRASMGKHNRQKMKNDFSYAKMISTHEDLLDKLWRQLSLPKA